MFIFSDKVYKALKHLVQVILPAVAALYFGLAALWDLPDPEKVAGTIACIQVFLGVCLGISGKAYNALSDHDIGNLVITEKEDGTLNYSFEATGDPLDIQTKREVTFKVDNRVTS